MTKRTSPRSLVGATIVGAAILGLAIFAWRTTTYLHLYTHKVHESFVWLPSEKRRFGPRSDTYQLNGRRHTVNHMYDLGVCEIQFGDITEENAYEDATEIQAGKDAAGPMPGEYRIIVRT